MGTGGYLVNGKGLLILQTISSGLATGADKIYYGDKITLHELQEDIDRLSKSFLEYEESSSVVLNNENSSKVFTTDVLAKIYKDQSAGLFEVRTANLGHIQQGGVPTASDRTFAAQLARLAVDFLEEQRTKELPSSGCAGIVDGDLKVTLIEDMIKEMDFSERETTNKWWNYMIPYSRDVTLRNAE